jgi:ribosomal protein L7/L12
MDTTASPGPDDEASIRALLQQGRKVDAIKFVRTNYQLDLTEAVDRVNEIDEKMKAAQ